MKRKSRFASTSLGLAGWAFETPLPVEKRYVALAVPHTSNWDGLVLVTVLAKIGLDMEWMIKDSWVKGPMRPIMKRLGAIAIDRGRAHDVVGQMIEEFGRRDRFVLGIPPEGTRSRAAHWKSGFYRIALGADVPVVPGYLDYARKRCGLGSPMRMTGDVRADMDRIRAFYAEKNPIPHEPSGFGPIRLKEEDVPT